MKCGWDLGLGGYSIWCYIDVKKTIGDWEVRYTHGEDLKRVIRNLDVEGKMATTRGDWSHRDDPHLQVTTSSFE